MSAAVMSDTATRLRPRPSELNASERAFLPAALEIVETPASPTARLTAMTICLFLTIVAIWAWFSHVDIIAMVPGKVVPAGRTKQVQAFEEGIVRKILVDDGDTVSIGQKLILLDPTMDIADRDRSRNLLTTAMLDQVRLTALLESLLPSNQETADPFNGMDASDDVIAEARGRLAADRAGRVARLVEADHQIAEKRSERTGLVAGIAKIDATLPLVSARASIRRESLERQVGNRIEYLNAAQQQIELENDRLVAVDKLHSTDAGIQALLANREKIAAETERDWRSDLQKARHDRAEALAQLAKAERRTGLTTVTAPVDGIVQDLSVHTEGGVVQASQQLLHVVPTSGGVVIEAVIENKDAGFVRAGQEAEIKVEAFPFTRYGLVHGRVAAVARDAAPDPEIDQKARFGTSPLGGAPNELRRSGGLVYVARIEMDDPSLTIDGVKTRLEPGMAITAEIKTGRRRVLDYILSPVARRAHEALTER
ncbi:HlyD family type I secretion periplasmic adaptor subunit [Bosea sp. 685]|uniref:HlyD family type I secretion periplasmic adaptor subunit n=1 Tax=Bosea sp. 685 TaxID=3080057 RepID=UPI0028937604|nr:HlyD family type I secretion periplasmic adaptor subunit [Bosea sp. 685]WNJ88634.1 HlyD family type I secretion periplasmic adaptor subunit [Bosea sp. 685]